MKIKYKIAGRWKAAAIVLALLLTIETILIISVWFYGNDIIKEEQECNDLCYYKGFDSYNYDNIEKLCLCSVGGEEVYRERID